MDKLTGVKVVFVAIISAVCTKIGLLALPVGLLIFCNIVDYATGIMAAWHNNVQLSSYKSLKGIAKKVSMWLLVVVGVVVDVTLLYAASYLGWAMPADFIVAVVVALWLVANELLSILENISGTGTAIPPFLKPIVERLKNKTESTGEDTKQ